MDNGLRQAYLNTPEKRKTFQTSHGNLKFLMKEMATRLHLSDIISGHFLLT